MYRSPKYTDQKKENATLLNAKKKQRLNETKNKLTKSLG